MYAFGGGHKVLKKLEKEKKVEDFLILFKKSDEVTSAQPAWSVRGSCRKPHLKKKGNATSIFLDLLLFYSQGDGQDTSPELLTSSPNYFCCVFFLFGLMEREYFSVSWPGTF